MLNWRLFCSRFRNQRPSKFRRSNTATTQRRLLFGFRPSSGLVVVTRDEWNLTHYFIAVKHLKLFTCLWNLKILILSQFLNGSYIPNGSLTASGNGPRARDEIAKTTQKPHNVAQSEWKLYPLLYFQMFKDQLWTLNSLVPEVSRHWWLGFSSNSSWIELCPSTWSTTSQSSS